MDFSALFRRAYLVTINNPAFWLLGLFLSSGFNAHWFVFFNKIQFTIQNLTAVMRQIFQNLPYAGAIIGFFLIMAVVGVIVSNWAKVLLFLHTANILKLKRIMPAEGQSDEKAVILANSDDQTVFGLRKKLIRESQNYLGQVLGVSVLTGTLTIAGAVILFYPAGYLLRTNQNQGIILALAIALFILLLLFLAFQNIFATLFIVLYQRRFIPALHLAGDLLVAKWQHIVVFAVMLLVLYGLTMSAAAGIIYLSKGVIVTGFAIVSKVNVHVALVLVRVEWILVSLLVLVWTAWLNTFSNIAFLLLFSELVKSQPAEFLASAELNNPLPLHLQ